MTVLGAVSSAGVSDGGVRGAVSWASRGGGSSKVCGRKKYALTGGQQQEPTVGVQTKQQSLPPGAPLGPEYA